MFYVVINCKQYRQVMGYKVVGFCRAVKRWPSVIVVPSIAMLGAVSKVIPGRVCAPHADNVVEGPSTGYVCPQELREIGVGYVLLNHNEHRVTGGKLSETIELCGQEKLRVIVCTKNLDEIRKYAAMNVWAVAYEPNELIGGEVSVTSRRTGILEVAVKICQRAGIGLLVGAGVHSWQDIAAAKKMGLQGVLLSHAVVSSKNPQIKIAEIIGKAGNGR